MHHLTKDSRSGCVMRTLMPLTKILKKSRMGQLDMYQLSQITNELYYKIFKNFETGQDYLNWSFSCIDYGIEVKSVLQLASLNSTDSLFIFKGYFRNS